MPPAATLSVPPTNLQLPVAYLVSLFLALTMEHMYVCIHIHSLLLASFTSNSFPQSPFTFFQPTKPRYLSISIYLSFFSFFLSSFIHLTRSIDPIIYLSYLSHCSCSCLNEGFQIGHLRDKYIYIWIIIRR